MEASVSVSEHVPSDKTTRPETAEIRTEQWCDHMGGASTLRNEEAIEAARLALDAEIQKYKRKPQEKIQAKGSDSSFASWGDLSDIFERQYRCCATCGIELQEPEEAELDHIIPRSSGGSNLKGNLQWLCIPCNRSKGTQTLDEFIDRCCRVAAHCKRDTVSH